MLLIETSEREWFNEVTQEFVTVKKESFQIEHSLVSLSKWESKWCKPFFGKDRKTDEEVLDYIRCMTITQNVKPETYLNLTEKELRQIDAYINAPMTATWFSDRQPRVGGGKETITAEIIYYWMISLNIPFECQKWHLNRLITLVRVCNIKNQPPKKQNRREMLNSRAALNAARKSQFHTSG